MANLRSNSEEAFVLASLTEFIHCWKSKQKATFSIKCEEGEASINFSCRLGQPKEKHVKNVKPRRFEVKKTPSRTARDNARAAAFQAANAELDTLKPSPASTDKKLRNTKLDETGVNDNKETKFSSKTNGVGSMVPSVAAMENSDLSQKTKTKLPELKQGTTVDDKLDNVLTMMMASSNVLNSKLSNITGGMTSLKAEVTSARQEAQSVQAKVITVTEDVADLKDRIAVLEAKKSTREDDPIFMSQLDKVKRSLSFGNMELGEWEKDDLAVDWMTSKPEHLPEYQIGDSS